MNEVKCGHPLYGMPLLVSQDTLTFDGIEAIVFVTVSKDMSIVTMGKFVLNTAKEEYV